MTENLGRRPISAPANLADPDCPHAAAGTSSFRPGIGRMNIFVSAPQHAL